MRILKLGAKPHAPRQNRGRRLGGKGGDKRRNNTKHLVRKKKKGYGNRPPKNVQGGLNPLDKPVRIRGFAKEKGTVYVGKKKRNRQIITQEVGYHSIEGERLPEKGLGREVTGKKKIPSAKILNICEKKKGPGNQLPPSSYVKKGRLPHFKRKRGQKLVLPRCAEEKGGARERKRVITNSEKKVFFLCSTAKVRKPTGQSL